MAIYKEKIGKKSATIRQGILWAFWGFLAGVYCLQPMLKAVHRDEKSILSDYISIEDGQAKVATKSEIQGETKEDFSKPHS